MSAIGLLYDSVSDNTGDQAIGLVLQRALSQAGVPLVVLPPLDVGDSGHEPSTVIVGGGELIRTPGDGFYDAFRVPGRHILNTVGVLDGGETDFLADYRLVTCRTEADRQRLGRGEVVPCLTMLYGEFAPRVALPDLPAGAVGMHLTYALEAGFLELARWLRRSDIGPVVFLPVTGYNADREIMDALAMHLPGSVLLPRLGPDQVFATVGKLRAMVSASLHAGLFAYAQGVPFLLYRGPGKCASFLDERDLGENGFMNTEEVAARLPALLDRGAPWEEKVEADQRLCRAHLQRMIGVCRDALAVPAIPTRQRVRGDARVFALEHQIHREVGQRTATMLRQLLALEAQTRAQPVEPVSGAGSQQPEHGRHAARTRRKAPRRAARRIRSQWPVLNFDDGRHRPIAVRDLSWLETSPEWRGLRAWLVRKEGWLPVGSWRRRIFDHAVRWLADLASAFMRAPKRMSARRNPRDGIRDGARTPQTPTERPSLGAGIDLAYRAYLRRVEPKAEKVWNAWTPRSGPPRISIVSAFGETSSHHFLRSAASLSAQLDPEWSWSVVVSGEEQRRRLQEVVAGESRCSVVTGEPGVGPIGHLNLALGNATADLVMQLDPGVMLAPWALTALAGAAEEDPRADWVYADHDHLDEFGRRLDPVFKPEMSPEGMLTINYLEPVSLFRRSILTRVGMLDPSLGSAAIWSLGLKAFQAGFRFRRVPQVLSHLPHGLDHRTTAAPDRARWRADRRKAIGAHLRASGAPSRLAGAHADGAATPRGTLRGSRSVSIIIPSKDQAAVLANCLEGTLRRTKYPRLDVCVVDTGSREPQTESLYETFRSDPAFSVIRLEPPFNFGRACNNGAAHVSGELLLFLNNDTEVLDPFWLSIMAGWFDLAGVGAVGAKLLYPDGRIQHGGVVVGMGGLASHLFQWMEEGTDSLFGTAERVRNVSAVTGACMLVSRAAFQAVGGFDEEFQLNYSDVDLCLRLRHAGFRIVYEPRARLIHHESLSHRRRIPRRDFELATERWAARGDLEGDPYYNPNLSYMSACPAFNLGPGDNPGALNRRLMRRMPRKQVLTLPDDLR